MQRDFYPKKSLGQCFLKDKNVLRKIEGILSINIKPEAIVIEIGPGLGALTQHLLKMPIRKLFLIEKDSRCAKYLTETLQWRDTSVVIINQDIRNINLDSLVGDSFYLVGNIPYYITGYVLGELLLFSQNLLSGFFMLQKDVFDKVVAQVNAKKYSFLSVVMQTFFDMRNFLIVSPGNFYPQPKVYSIFAGFFPKKAAIAWPVEKKRKFIGLLRKAFSNRRKMLKNNLKEELLRRLPVGLGVKRPQELSVEEWIELFETLYTVGV